MTKPSQPTQRICIVTSECVGPFKNGGIGTSMTGLAEMLAENHRDVVLLYTRGAYLTNKQVQKWREVYSQNGIDFQAIRPADFRNYTGPLASIGYLTPSFIVDFLQRSNFDVVHFNDTDGEGFLAHAMHRTGLLLPNATFLTNIHSPREWVGMLNGEAQMHPIDLSMRAAERFSIANSDMICGPSQYLLNWIGERGFERPKRVEQIQYVMPQDVQHNAEKISRNVSNDNAPMRRVVFFGRLEERKGLRLFLDAIEGLVEELSKANIKIVFLGRSVMLGGKTSRDYISEVTQDWAIDCEIVTDKGQKEALEFLCDAGTLTVMASPADNSPCTVYECLLMQIPFIAAKTGGIPELIAQEFHDTVLFDHDVTSLRDQLLRRLEGSEIVPTLAVSQSESTDQWLALHDSFRLKKPKSQPTGFDLQKLLVLVDATMGRDGENSTAASVEKTGVPLSNIVVLKKHTLRDDRFPTVDPAGMVERLKNHDGAVLVIGAGLIISDIDALKSAALAAKSAPCLGFALSAYIGGARLDHPGCGAAVALSHGPSAAHCTLLANGKKAVEFFDQDLSDVGPAFGLLDQLTQSGAGIWPLALAFVSAQNKQSMQNAIPMTDSRLALYSNLKRHEQAAILVQANLGTKVNLKMLARKLVFQIAQSRFGFLVPYISMLREKVGI